MDYYRSLSTHSGGPVLSRSIYENFMKGVLKKLRRFNDPKPKMDL